jgi:hypothetical protein
MKLGKKYLWKVLYRDCSFLLYQIFVHLGKRFQRRRFFRNQPIRNKNGLWCPCLLMDQEEMSNLCRGPSVEKVLYKDCSFCPDPLTNMATTGNSCFWLADFFKSSPLKLLSQMNRNLVGSSFDSFWPGSFRGEDFFRNQPIRNKNGLWRPCLLTNQDEMSNLYRGPSIQMIWNLVRSIYGRSSTEIAHFFLIH